MIKNIKIYLALSNLFLYFAANNAGNYVNIIFY